MYSLRVPLLSGLCSDYKLLTECVNGYDLKIGVKNPGYSIRNLRF